MASTPQQKLQKLLAVARTWWRARRAYRQILDKRSARQVEVDRAKKRLLKLTNDLETAIGEFEAVYQQMERQGLIKKKGQIPWLAIAKFIANGVGGVILEQQQQQPGMQGAPQPQQPQPPPYEPPPPGVIDVEGESVER